MSLKDKLNEITESGKEKVSNEVALKKKQLNERCIVLPLNKGRFNNKLKVWQQHNGTIYLNNNTDSLYRVHDFLWNGPDYELVTETKTKGKNKGKQKRTGRVLGAAIGTVLLPGAGTIIGAMHGTGNKKTKGKNKERSISKTSKEEIGTPAVLELQNLETDEIISINFICTSKLASQINNILAVDYIDADYDEDDYYNEDEEDNSVSNPYDELKQLKELLDMEIITQEEFDLKKKDLLDL